MKSLLRLSVSLCALLALSCLSQVGAHRPPVPPGVKLLKDLKYGEVNGRALELNLYLPEQRDKPMPLIIWVHGGGWQAGSKDSGSPAVGFTTEGYAVAHVGYRLSQEAIFPAQIYDCKAAVRWLRANAQEYGLDPTKFAAWGGSAGGHLVALLGTSGGVAELEGKDNSLQTSSRVQAVIDWYGPTDLLRITNGPGNSEYNTASAPVTKLLGGRVLEKMELAAKASPVTYVSKGKEIPPFLIMHGDQDRTVPIKQSEEFYEDLKQAGVDVTFIPVKGAGHGALGAQATEPVREFLKRCFGDRPQRRSL